LSPFTRFLLGWFVRQEMHMTGFSSVRAMAAAFAALLATESYAAGSAALLHSVASESRADLKAMEGKRVLGKNRELLGHLGKVDEQAKMAQLKTPSGAIIPLSIDLLVEDGEDLAAPSLSRGDVIAMTNKPDGGPSLYEAGVAPKSGSVP
jgi:hypothetical protein